jgi:hypothetical protein
MRLTPEREKWIREQIGRGLDYGYISEVLAELYAVQEERDRFWAALEEIAKPCPVLDKWEEDETNESNEDMFMDALQASTRRRWSIARHALFYDSEEK